MSIYWMKYMVNRALATLICHNSHSLKKLSLKKKRLNTDYAITKSI